MYSESDIDAAVTAGALSPDAAAAFRRFISGERETPAADEESFRLITGFNDIFVSIAVVLLLVAVGQIGMAFSPVLSGVLVAAAAWGLAEHFTARRRMALPSILLLLAFVGGVAGAVASLVETIAPNLPERAEAMAVALAGLCAAAAAWAHWRRFMVPITVAAGAVAIVGMAAGLVTAALPEVEQILWPLLLACGIVVFGIAMRWDMSDPQRTTRRSDVAFWLHLAAAPLIAHSVFQMLGVFRDDIGVGTAVIVMVLYAVFAFIALAVDRRALLVSSLVYVLYAMYALFRSAGAIELPAAFTALVIGSALLSLSAFWQPIRRAAVGLLTPALRQRLPPTPQPA